MHGSLLPLCSEALWLDFLGLLSMKSRRRILPQAIVQH